MSLELSEPETDQAIRFISEDGSFAESVDLTSMSPTNGKYTLNAAIITGGYTDASEGSADPDIFTVNIMAGSSIGTLYYHSSEPSSKGRSYIDSSKDKRGSGTAVVTDSDGNVINSGATYQTVSDIHARGNSSFRNSAMH